jgi:hypothetical protein
MHQMPPIRRSYLSQKNMHIVSPSAHLHANTHTFSLAHTRHLHHTTNFLGPELILLCDVKYFERLSPSISCTAK